MPFLAAIGPNAKAEMGDRQAVAKFRAYSQLQHQGFSSAKDRPDPSNQNG